MPPEDPTPQEQAPPGAARAETTLVQSLFRSVDGASLAVFRILFGLVMAWEAFRYLDGGRIRRDFIFPQLHFTYYGFSWVTPWPGDWMIVHFVVVLIAGLGVAFGACYRLSAVLLWLSFTYTYLIDQALYLNHLYLVSLICFMMIFFPANRMLSMDALLWRSRRSDWIPVWPVWALRTQIGLVYFYAGIAKINWDWLRCEPALKWMQERADWDLFDGLIPIGRIFDYDLTIWFIAYGGLLFDLLVTFFLLWRRTRVLAFCFMLFFHFTNFYLFNIGIFPWVMMAATLIYFEPGWPRRVFNLQPRPVDPRPTLRPKPAWRQAIAYGLTVWFAVQVLFPLRHFAYPGNVHWTEEGHRFAWHMKLRSKSGKATFTVSDPKTGLYEDIDLDEYLTPRQIEKMATHPDMILQFAHYLARVYKEKGHDPKVRARVLVSLNGRPPVLYIDANRDLSKVKRDLWPADWVHPFDPSVPPGRAKEDDELSQPEE